MPFKESIRSFIIGPDRFIPSRSNYKTSLLRGYFSVGMLVIGLLYLVLDAVHGIFGNLFFYTLLIVAGSLSLSLNRRGKTLAANVVLLLVSNVSVWLYAASYRNQNAIYVFFIPAALFAMGLFDYRQKKWWLSFVLLSLGLFLATALLDVQVLKKIGFTELVTGSIFTLNFVVAFIFSVLLLFFIIRLNHHSERKLSEREASLIFTTEELKKSRQRFELAIKGSNAGIWEWDIRTNAVYNSPVWKAMLGFGEQELEPMTLQGFLDRIHPDDLPFVNNALQEHLEKQSQYQVEFRMSRKDGRIIWVADRGIALNDEEGKPAQMVGSIIDITERKEAEERIILQNNMLAKTNAELDRFVYSTSHDLRSPLSSLLGLITIAERTDDPTEVTACLGMMKDRIRTMEVFIKEIIDYSRNTRLAVKREPVRLFPLINDVVESLRFSEGAENIFVRYNIPPDLDLYTDENRFRVVLNNLIGNSIKYHDTTRDNPFISIEARIQDDRIHIVIEDNGIGIGQEHQARIFDMFYRASEKSHGSGLGLYIVKETIEKLAGTVGVTSEPGAGTRFLMQFPFVHQPKLVENEDPKA